MQTTPLKFKEESFLFEEEPEKFKARSLTKGVFDFGGVPEKKMDPELLGIKIRLGNEPIVRNLFELTQLAGKQLSPELHVLYKDKELYTITHAIGVLRLKGRAKVSELQYNAEIIDLKGAQTIDLLPNTSFKTIWQLNMNFQGGLKAGGKFSAEIPKDLTDKLLDKHISFGGDMEVQLSTDSNFIGKFSCGLKLPVIQAAGEASSSCTWVLNPDENPLLGDQVLIQTIAVPKGTKQLNYQMKGLIKADKGIFWKKQTAETSTYNIQINL